MFLPLPNISVNTCNPKESMRPKSWSLGTFLRWVPLDWLSDAELLTFRNSFVSAGREVGKLRSVCRPQSTALISSDSCCKFVVRARTAPENPNKELPPILN